MITDSALYEGCPDGENWGTGCLLIMNNQLLLGLRTDNTLWGSPGGGVEVGESPVQGVIREVKEETGLDVCPDSLEYVGQGYSLNEGYIWHSFVFVCSRFSGELKRQKEEVAELKWVPINSLGEYSLFTPTRESIRIVLMNRPELLYADFYDILKMTSIEQLVDVKNPGRNGGHGQIVNGNWNYTKSKTSRPAQEKPKIPQTNQQVQQLKQSYIAHFQNNDIKVRYTVDDGEFIFPDYATAKADRLVENKEQYRILFNEQYIHYKLLRKK